MCTCGRLPMFEEWNRVSTGRNVIHKLHELVCSFYLTFTALWANSADQKLITLFLLFFSEYNFRYAVSSFFFQNIIFDMQSLRRQFA